MSLMPSAPPKQKLVTQQQYDQTLQQFDAQNPDSGYQGWGRGGTSDDKASKRQELADSMLVPPAAAPDLSDDLVQKKALLARRRLLLGGGLTGPLNLAPAGVSTPTLTGS